MPSETNRAILAELLPDVVVSPTYQTGAWRFIIRFGDATGSDDNALVLNRASALATPDLTAKAQEHWRASSLRYHKPENRVTFYKRYRVQVFDCTAIYMQRVEIGSRRVRVIRPNLSRETRRVSELAWRALYTAGLDIGAVDIGLSSSGKLYVLSINPCPRFNRAIGAAYARHITAWMQRMEGRGAAGPLRSLLNPQENECPQYLLGADPEFTLRDARTGRMVFASDYFPMQGVIGCDARRVRLGRSGYPLAEVRPAPTQCPLELYESIRDLLLMAHRKVPRRYIQWRAGTLPFSQLPVGGHIHFSMLPTNHFLRALDNSLAVVFLMLENPGAARRRRRSYGWLGDYRLKKHGGFEYRAIPSWLVSPVFARGALCLAKVIGCDWHRWRYDFFLRPEAQVAFKRADQDYFRVELAKVLVAIRSLPSYSKYFQEIEALLNYVEQGRRWTTATDIRRSWRLRASSRT